MTQIQEYLTYICDDLLSRYAGGYLQRDAIDTSDSTYQKTGQPIKSISLKDYLTLCGKSELDRYFQDFLQKEIIWIPMRVYQALTDYLIDYLKTDTRISQNFCISICFRRTPFPESEIVSGAV